MYRLERLFRPESFFFCLVWFGKLSNSVDFVFEEYERVFKGFGASYAR
jgi:hypothetical protein